MKRFLFILLLFFAVNVSVADELNNSDIVDNEIEQIEKELPDEPNNPINYDASPNNIKENNYNQKPQIEEQKQEVKQDKKKQKAEKKSKKQKKQEEAKSEDKTQTQETTENKDDTQSQANTENQDETQNQDSGEKSELDEYIHGTEEENSQEPQQPKTYSQEDYEQVYRDLPVPTFSFIHGIDPEQYFEMKDAAWSPYPLLRLNAPIYFKSVVIQPGYYLLTPRQYKKDWYILFKEAGVVKYIIPVFAKNFTSESYYRDNLKELDMKKSQRWQIKFLNAWGKYVKSSKRQPATKTNLELTDLDNNFLLIDLYYGPHKYSTIFKTERY